MVTCYIGLGSNLGNRRMNIRSAIRSIEALPGTAVIKVSRIIETDPRGGPKTQGKFLNACIKIMTNLAPAKLLRDFKKIEMALGRKETVRWGPRTIDLDILLYGDKIINRQELVVPHPRMCEREFVIKPLLDVL